MTLFNTFPCTCCSKSLWGIQTYLSLRIWTNSSLGCTYSRSQLVWSSSKLRRSFRRLRTSSMGKMLVEGPRTTRKRQASARPFLNLLRSSSGISWRRNWSETISWTRRNARRARSNLTTRWPGRLRRGSRRQIIELPAASGSEYTLPWF